MDSKTGIVFCATLIWLVVASHRMHRIFVILSESSTSSDSAIIRRRVPRTQIETDKRHQVTGVTEIVSYGVFVLKARDHIFYIQIFFSRSLTQIWLLSSRCIVSVACKIKDEHVAPNSTDLNLYVTKLLSESSGLLNHMNRVTSRSLSSSCRTVGGRVIYALGYKSRGRWFDPPLLPNHFIHQKLSAHKMTWICVDVP